MTDTQQTSRATAANTRISLDTIGDESGVSIQVRREGTRTGLSIFVVTVLTLQIVVGYGAMFLYGPDHVEKISTFINMFFTPTVTLAGTVLGFYFGSSKTQE